MTGSQQDVAPYVFEPRSETTDHEVAHALAGGAPQRVGWFRYFFDDDRWEWSEQVERMHGYAPGSVTPTTRLVLSHKHPDDYRQIADTLELIRQTREAFSSRHRICDVHGNIHHVVVVGDELHDGQGQVVGTHGFYIDVTPVEQARQDHITAEVARISETRAEIEQAKGMLMMVYRISAAAAFELLKWCSQQTNVKLYDLAKQIAADFAGVPYDAPMPPQATYDKLLMSAHRRIRADA
jgi:PAS domain S-box-containing protein